MSLSKQGFNKAQRLLNRLPATTKRHLHMANADNAQEVARVARVLVPVGQSGRAKASIRVSPTGDGGQIVDFGPLSKILEGGTGPRANKSGANRGKGPKIPFVNPAFQAIRKKRRKRSQKALRDAIREAGNG